MQQRILICGPSWVGDMVMAHSLVQLLRRFHPHAGIDMLAPEWSRSVARCMAEISTVITLPFDHGELALRQRMSFGQTLSGLGYDSCYILPNSFKSALVPWFARIPERIGWRAEGRTLLLTDARRLDTSEFPKMYQRYAALACDPDHKSDCFPNPALQHEPAEMRNLANRFNLRETDKLIALAPGAEFGPSKQWHLQGFIDLTRMLLDKGYKVVLVGSPGDSDLCQQIAVNSNDDDGSKIVSLAGRTSIEQVIHLLPLCKAIVCHDSGVMHIAAALGVPLVAIYGSTSPQHTPPLSDRAKVIRKQIECAPCFKRECPLEHHKCMRLIEADEVFDAVEFWVNQ